MRLRTAFIAGLAALTAALAVVPSAGAATNSQRFFRNLILRDTQTAPRISQLLRREGGFVDPKILFADLTGDTRDDAVALVSSGGAAGDVALYVFSTEGPNRTTVAIRPVLRLESLFRASALIRRNALVVRTPRYVANDDLCCPAQLQDESFRWNRRTARLFSGGTVRLPGSR